MLKILNAEPEDYSPKAKAILESFAHYDEASPDMSRAELIDALSDYDVLIVRLGNRVDAELLAKTDHLKVVVTATTGTTHIDENVLTERGIALLCLEGERAFLDRIAATSEHCFGLMLALIRKTIAAHNHVMDGGWDRNQFKGYELAGRILGIIGYGRLGRIVAHYAKAFGMTVLACDVCDIEAEAGITFVSMQELLERSDIVSLHVNYTDDTHHLIDAACFQSMKRGALFINTARGEIVDESALLSVLESKHLGGAALDVLQDENGGIDDWVEGNPLIQYSRTHDNLIVTPHIGGASYDSMEKTEIFMAEKLKHWVREGQSKI